MTEIYDRHGNPIDWDTFIHLTRDDNSDYWLIGRDQIGATTVTTMWFGLDHLWPWHQAPRYHPGALHLRHRGRRRDSARMRSTFPASDIA